MKGKILDFNSESRTGIITADDGNRYNFDVAQWKSSVLPKSGAKVDFSVNNGSAEAIAKRPAVRRGRMVNRVTGPLNTQLHERHDASDFDTRTQDKLQAPT